MSDENEDKIVNDDMKPVRMSVGNEFVCVSEQLSLEDKKMFRIFNKSVDETLLLILQDVDHTGVCSDSYNFEYEVSPGGNLEIFVGKNINIWAKRKIYEKHIPIDVIRCPEE